MHYTTHRLSYESTGYFSKIVSDYLQQSPSLQEFYQHTPDLAGIRAAITARQSFDTPRMLLQSVLRKQYEGITLTEKVRHNIDALSANNTFAVTTAHQPNIFTGPLYFIYKIFHAIKLSEELNEAMPEHHFVPVYYMGSEDADLDELGYVNVGGEKLVWQTKQTGAVGRMKVDKALIGLMHAMEGQTGVLAHGASLSALLRACYTEGKTIQQATLELVNALFGCYGLVVLVPDHAALKTAFQEVVQKELLEKFSHTIVAATIEKLSRQYKVQAGGREINLFYLVDDKRERIEWDDNRYMVKSLGLHFTKDTILQELDTHPERFSANVILRGAFQETVLPGIAFIGGGGELAYWLELKDVFKTAGIPYPVLLLRNSFLLLTKEQETKMKRLELDAVSLFQEEGLLLDQLVKRMSGLQLSLNNELQEVDAYYERLKTITSRIDITLKEHVTALQAKAIQRLRQLEKKMLRAEKTKFGIQQKQISRLKQSLFPGNSLQERTDNFSVWYAQYGEDWLKLIHDASEGLAQQFSIITLA